LFFVVPFCWVDELLIGKEWKPSVEEIVFFYKKKNTFVLVSCSKNQKQILEFRDVRDAFDFFIDCKYCPSKTKSSSFKVNII
jgi:hypothetical protein